MNPEFIETLKKQVDPIAERHGAFLVDVELEKGDMEELWIYVDSETSDVTIEQCAGISREAAALLDEEKISDGRFRMNVSSPGLSRPLTDKRQYGKNKGRLARIRYKSTDSYKKVTGKIDSADLNNVVLSEDGNLHTISLDLIVEAKILPEF